MASAATSLRLSSQKIPCGATVTCEAVHDFDNLKLEEATKIIYERVVPECERKKVMLSYFGNHNAGGLMGVKEYDELKDNENLFQGEIQRIQKIFTFLSQHCHGKSLYNKDIDSYGLKGIVERRTEYITNGEFIVAMLLHGYSARFGMRSDKMCVNAHFKAEITEAKDDSKSKE